MKVASGRPLDSDYLEYRLFYVGQECLACYIVAKDRPADLDGLKAFLKEDTSRGLWA